MKFLSPKTCGNVIGIALLMIPLMGAAPLPKNEHDILRRAPPTNPPEREVIDPKIFTDTQGDKIKDLFDKVFLLYRKVRHDNEKTKLVTSCKGLLGIAKDGYKQRYQDHYDLLEAPILEKVLNRVFEFIKDNFEKEIRETDPEGGYPVWGVAQEVIYYPEATIGEHLLEWIDEAEWQLLGIHTLNRLTQPQGRGPLPYTEQRFREAEASRSSAAGAAPPH